MTPMPDVFCRDRVGDDLMDIPRVIEATMEAHKDDFTETPSLDDIISVDAWARQHVAEIAAKESVSS